MSSVLTGCGYSWGRGNLALVRFFSLDLNRIKVIAIKCSFVTGCCFFSLCHITSVSAHVIPVLRGGAGQGRGGGGGGGGGE